MPKDNNLFNILDINSELFCASIPKHSPIHLYLTPEILTEYKNMLIYWFGEEVAHTTVEMLKYVPQHNDYSHVGYYNEKGYNPPLVFSTHEQITGNPICPKFSCLA